jgi:hypothetical protein
MRHLRFSKSHHEAEKFFRIVIMSRHKHERRSVERPIGIGNNQSKLVVEAIFMALLCAMFI